MPWGRTRVDGLRGFTEPGRRFMDQLPHMHLEMNLGMHMHPQDALSRLTCLTVHPHDCKKDKFGVGMHSNPEGMQSNRDSCPGGIRQILDPSLYGTLIPRFESQIPFRSARCAASTRRPDHASDCTALD